MGKNKIENRLQPLVVFVRLLVFILLSWSAGNGFLFAQAAIGELTGNQQLAVGGALAFALLFEAGKYFFGAYTLRLLLRGWWREGRLYGFALALLLPVSLGWFAGSYWLTTQGGLEGLQLQVSRPDFQPNKKEAAPAPNPDLTALRLARDSVYQQAMARSSPRTATRLFMAFQDAINRLETTAADERKTAQQTQNTRKGELQRRLERVIQWLRHFGGWSELLTIILLVFLEMYAWETSGFVAKSNTGKQKNAAKTSSVSYLKQRARQCWKRAHQADSSEKTRETNRRKAATLFQELKRMGIRVKPDAANPQQLHFFTKKQAPQNGKKPQRTKSPT